MDFQALEGKQTPPFHNMNIQKMEVNYLRAGSIGAMIGTLVVLGLGIFQGLSQIPPTAIQQLNEALENRDFHAVSLAVDAWASRVRTAPDDQKLLLVKDAISFAAAIQSTCDPSLHAAFDIGPEPPFDWQKYGIRPIFNGESPEAIENSMAREAYKSALSEHRKLMARVSAERQQLEEGDYCARAAVRVIESSANHMALREAVAKHIASIQNAQWIKERLIQIVLPKSQTNEQAPPQNNAPVSQPLSGDSSPSLSSVQMPSLEPNPRTKPTPKPNEKTASLTLWSIISVLTVAAGGLLWFLLKRRS